MQDIKQQLREIRALVEIEDAQELFFKVLDKQISLAVEQEKERVLAMVLKEIEEMKKDNICYQNNKPMMHYECDCSEKSSFNQALDTLKTKLQAKE